MRLFQFVVAFAFVAGTLQAGIMPEEASKSATETIISLNDQKVDYSSDVKEIGSNIKEKIEDFLNFAFMAIFLAI